MPEDAGCRCRLNTDRGRAVTNSVKYPFLKNFTETDAQNTPFFCDFPVRDDSNKYTPFRRNLEHSWLPLFMLSEGTGVACR